MVTDCRLDDLTPEARAAIVTKMLLERNTVTTDEIKRKTGIRSGTGVRYLMSNIGMALSVWQPQRGIYALLDG